MSDERVRCVVLADRHPGLIEGIRGLLESSFEAVVMVADERSLYESVERLQPILVVVDVSLARCDHLRWLRQVHERCSTLKLILLSVHNEASACQLALASGADGYVLKYAVATELLPAIDAVLEGKQYVSLGVVGGPSVKSDWARPKVPSSRTGEG